MVLQHHVREVRGVPRPEAKDGDDAFGCGDGPGVDKVLESVPLEDLEVDAVAAGKGLQEHWVVGSILLAAFDNDLQEFPPRESRQWVLIHVTLLLQFKDQTCAKIWKGCYDLHASGCRSFLEDLFDVLIHYKMMG